MGDHLRTWVHDPSHPEHDQKDLIWVDDSFSEDYKEMRMKQGRPVEEQQVPHDNELERKKELCWACGWTMQNQIQGGYSPRIKVMHARNNMGLWDLGGQWVLRDEPNNKAIGNDYITLKFLHDQGSKLPLPGEVLLISGLDEKVRFTLTKKVLGQWLGLVWHTLSLESRKNLRRQMARIVKALRRFTRPTAQKVDGTPLEDFLIGRCLPRSPSCTKIGSTTEEWLDALAPTLRGGLSNIHKTNDPIVIEEKLAELRANFPSGEPYYLTHGDLNMSNIFVEGDKITAIIDWEFSGFMPWWVERWTASFHDNELLGRIWANVEPEVDQQTFMSTVVQPVGEVINAWEACKVDHPNMLDRWMLPAFSECQSAGGSIDWVDCGNQVGHKINPNQWDDKGQK